MKPKFVNCYLVTCLLILTASQTTTGKEIGTLEERVRERTLDNGLKVVVVERHAAPVFFTLVSFRVGASHESPDHSGLSHFLEHMLFKGTKTIGTTDYAKEVPILEELESVAAEIKDIRITLKPWRCDLFDEYVTGLKSELPPEVWDVIGADEAAGWRTVLDQLPRDIARLPEEWTRTEWLLADRRHNYWSLYARMLEYRARMAELMAQQREYINQNEFSRIYSTHGSRIINASTGYDHTTYMVGLPSNCLELWMFIESDRFRNPVFREFYSEREVVMEEKRMRENNPDGLIYQSLFCTAFRAHPYGRPILGWMSDIRLTNRTDIEEHWGRFYAPNNCQLTIVGDVDANKVFKLANKYFGSWEPSKVADEVKVVEPEQNGERRIEVEHDAEPQFVIGYHVPVAPHPDAYAIAMIDQVLSVGKTSRLYRSIFVEQGLTASSPGVAIEPADRYPNLFTIHATPKSPHTTTEVETALLTEIEKLKDQPVDERELERARNRFKMHQLNRMSNNYWLAFTLSSGFVNRGDWRSITDDFNRLMEVTPEDIQRVATKYFTARNRTVATLVKPGARAEAFGTGKGELQ